MCPRCKTMKLEEKNGEWELIEKLIKINKGEKIIFWLVFIIFFMGSFLVRDKFEKDNNIVSLNNISSQNNAKNNSIWNFGNYNYNQVQNDFKIDVESASKNKWYMTNTSDSEEDKLRKTIANELIQDAQHHWPNWYLPLEWLLSYECVWDCLDAHIIIKTTNEQIDKNWYNYLTTRWTQLASSVYWKLNSVWNGFSDEYKQKLIAIVDIVINDKLSYICLCKQWLDNECIDVKNLWESDNVDTQVNSMIRFILNNFSDSKKGDSNFLKAYCKWSCLSWDIMIDYIEYPQFVYPWDITKTASDLASKIHFVLKRYVDLPITVQLRHWENIKTTCTASNWEIAVCN